MTAFFFIPWGPTTKLPLKFSYFEWLSHFWIFTKFLTWKWKGKLKNVFVRTNKSKIVIHNAENKNKTPAACGWNSENWMREISAKCEKVQLFLVPQVASDLNVWPSFGVHRLIFITQQLFFLSTELATNLLSTPKRCMRCALLVRRDTLLVLGV
jgi:hypothetical protein